MKFEYDLDGEPVAIELVCEPDGTYKARIGEREICVTVPHVRLGYVVLRIDGVPYRAQTASTKKSQHVALGGEFYDFRLIEDEPRARMRAGHAGGASSGRVASPMPGRVARILVEEGASVAANQGLLILEAMKMENEIRAPKAGKVVKIHVKTGQMVMPAETLVELE